MDSQNCKMGTRVALISKDQPCNKGAIKGEVESHKSHGQVVIVEWDSGSLQKVTLRSLITEAEGVAQDTRIREQQERMEAEWAETETSVTDKLNAAAVLIHEANALASKAGKELYEMYESTGRLMGALDDAGWRTSSLSC
jgi:hypothetical protein